MSNIRANIKRGTVYDSVTQYSSDWDLMFNNAREFNQEDSDIYRDTYSLQRAFNDALAKATRIHGISIEDPE